MERNGDITPACITAYQSTPLEMAIIRRAIAYSLPPWVALTRFLDDGLCTSNNVAEREVRVVAVGRRNWTYIMRSWNVSNSIPTIRQAFSLLSIWSASRPYASHSSRKQECAPRAIGSQPFRTIPAIEDTLVE